MKRKVAWETVCALRTSDPTIPIAVLAREHSATPSTVAAILRGVAYKQRGYVPNRPPKLKLSWPIVREIRRLRTQGATLAELADHYGVSRVAVHQVCVAHHWAHDPEYGRQMPIPAPERVVKPPKRKRSAFAHW